MIVSTSWAYQSMCILWRWKNRCQEVRCSIDGSISIPFDANNWDVYSSSVDKLELGIGLGHPTCGHQIILQIIIFHCISTVPYRCSKRFYESKYRSLSFPWVISTSDLGVLSAINSKAILWRRLDTYIKDIDIRIYNFFSFFWKKCTMSTYHYDCIHCLCNKWGVFTVLRASTMWMKSG